ncbi:LPXTG cell wall anchor domain-containing protein [Enterococcus sp. DIV0187]|uniref:LPXTG cell wall anchor domain-containing protein n=1 Tax=Enterococcus sp. DIV0187 TaxID=2774644 RepID=UPI003F20094F
MKRKLTIICLTVLLGLGLRTNVSAQSFNGETEVGVTFVESTTEPSTSTTSTTEPSSSTKSTSDRPGIPKASGGTGTTPQQGTLTTTSGKALPQTGEVIKMGVSIVGVILLLSVLALQVKKSGGRKV